MEGARGRPKSLADLSAWRVVASRLTEPTFRFPEDVPTEVLQASDQSAPTLLVPFSAEALFPYPAVILSGVPVALVG